MFEDSIDDFIFFKIVCRFDVFDSAARLRLLQLEKNVELLLSAIDKNRVKV